jgi:hypothetical protein
MIAPVQIRFDRRKLADLVKLLGDMPKALPGVISRALNRTAQAMRSHVSHDAAAALGIPLRPIRSRIHTSWAREDKLRATVYIDEAGFSLWHFNPIQTRIGVVTTRGFEGAFPHAFIATPWIKSTWKNRATGETIMSESAPDGFKREFEKKWKESRKQKRWPMAPMDWVMSKAGQAHPNVYIRKGKERFPLLQQRSPGAVEAIQKAGGWDAKYAEALSYLEKRLAAETERVLAGGKWTGVASGLNESWGEWTSRMGAEYVEREAA